MVVYCSVTMRMFMTCSVQGVALLQLVLVLAAVYAGTLRATAASTHSPATTTPKMAIPFGPAKPNTTTAACKPGQYLATLKGTCTPRPVCKTGAYLKGQTRTKPGTCSTCSNLSCLAGQYRVGVCGGAENRFQCYKCTDWLGVFPCSIGHYLTMECSGTTNDYNCTAHAKCPAGQYLTGQSNTAKGECATTTTTTATATTTATSTTQTSTTTIAGETTTMAAKTAVTRIPPGPGLPTASGSGGDANGLGQGTPGNAAVGTAAMGVSTSSNNTPATQLAGSDNDDGDGSPGSVAGVVIGCVLGGALLTLVHVLLLRRHCRSNGGGAAATDAVQSLRILPRSGSLQETNFAVFTNSTDEPLPKNHSVSESATYGEIVDFHANGGDQATRRSSHITTHVIDEVA